MNSLGMEVLIRFAAEQEACTSFSVLKKEERMQPQDPGPSGLSHLQADAGGNVPETHLAVPAHCHHSQRSRRDASWPHGRSQRCALNERKVRDLRARHPCRTKASGVRRGAETDPFGCRNHDPRTRQGSLQVRNTVGLTGEAKGKVTGLWHHRVLVGPPDACGPGSGRGAAPPRHPRQQIDRPRAHFPGSSQRHCSAHTTRGRRRWPVGACIRPAPHPTRR